MVLQMTPTLSYGRNYLRLSIAEGTLTATNTVRVIDTVASTPGTLVATLPILCAAQIRTL